MHNYRIMKAMDLTKFVHTTFPALDGPPAVPETYMVSKELVAYLEILVAFTLYYRGDDGKDGNVLHQGPQTLQSVQIPRFSQVHHQVVDCILQTL